MRFILAFLVLACLLAGCKVQTADAARKLSALGPAVNGTQVFAFHDLDKTLSDAKDEGALDKLVPENLGGKWRITDAPVVDVKEDGYGDNAMPCVVVTTDLAFGPVTYYFRFDPSQQQAVNAITVGNKYDFEGSGATLGIHEKVSEKGDGIFHNVVRLNATRFAESP